MFRVILVVWLAALCACSDDKAEGLPPIDASRVEDSVLPDGTGGGVEDEEEPEEGEQECSDHEDCDDDFLCFEDVCVDRNDALEDCDDDLDCPRGFECVEADHCEEI